MGFDEPNSPECTNRKRAKAGVALRRGCYMFVARSASTSALKYCEIMSLQGLRKDTPTLRAYRLQLPPGADQKTQPRAMSERHGTGFRIWRLDCSASKASNGWVLARLSGGEVKKELWANPTPGSVPAGVKIAKDFCDSGGSIRYSAGLFTVFVNGEIRLSFRLTRATSNIFRQAASAFPVPDLRLSIPARARVTIRLEMD